MASIKPPAFHLPSNTAHRSLSSLFSSGSFPSSLCRHAPLCIHSVNISSFLAFQYRNSFKQTKKFPSFSTFSLSECIFIGSDHVLSDPISEFADAVEKFISYFTKLSRKDIFEDVLEEVLGICKEIFGNLLCAKYGGGSGTFLSIPLPDIADTMNKRYVPGGPRGALAAVFRAQSYAGKNWNKRNKAFPRSKRIPLKDSKQVNWEDPDGGSENEDEEEEIQTSLDNAKDTNEKYDELVKEVCELLDPEEREILQQNENPAFNKISTAKWTPFHTLAQSGQIYFMDKLLEHGFDIDLIDKDGLTALHKAVISKKEAVISHLLRKGANPHVKDKEGWTPLHAAIQSRNRDIAKVLLVNGADKTRRNKDGGTPLDISLCFGKDFESYELAKLLKLVPAQRGF